MPTFKPCLPGSGISSAMIAARLLCAVGEPHSYAETVVTLECGGASFAAKGRTVIAEGLERNRKGVSLHGEAEIEETG